MRKITEYLKDIERHPILSLEKELELGKEKNNGNEESKNKLINSNLRFVVSVAREYQHKGLPLSDLIQEGNRGLMRAVEKFDSSKGCRVITYAKSWIKRDIRFAIKDNSYAVKIPQDRWHKANEILLLKGEGCTNSEISRKTKKTKKDVEHLMSVFYTKLSLDDSIHEEGNGEEDGKGDGEEKAFIDIIQDNRYNPEESVDSLQELGPIICKELSKREANITKKRFGLNGKGIYSLEELGNLYDITGEAVRQIQNKALKKLQKVLRIKELEYLVKS